MRFAGFEDTRKSLTPRIIGIGLLLLAVVLIAPKSDGSLVANSTSGQASPSLSKQLDTMESYVDLAPKAKKPLIYAKQYVLLDASNAEVIISQGEDTPVPIASTTKMTTALVAMAKLPLDKIVTVSSKPPTIQGSKIGLRSGEKISVRSLIQALLIYSGNDAAFTLAEAYAKEPGDYLQFVKAMNDFATTNHLVNTTYGDPAGLDDQVGRSTPRELANVARMLLQQPFLAGTVATENLTVSSVDGQISHVLKNTNRLVQVENPYYLANAIGVKTGFTLDAGHSLVAAYKWNDRVLIGVVMNTIEFTNAASAVEMNKLFRWADASLVLKQY